MVGWKGRRDGTGAVLQKPYNRLLRFGPAALYKELHTVPHTQSLLKASSMFPLFPPQECFNPSFSRYLISSVEFRTRRFPTSWQRPPDLSRDSLYGPPSPALCSSMSPTSFCVWCLLLAHLVPAAYVYPNGSRLDQIHSMHAWEGFVYDMEVPSQGFTSKFPANSTSYDLCLCSHARPQTR
jgi:hypothetical protein